MNKRVAVYGGAFNPVHVGHAMVASWVHLTGKADEVWFVPSASHPFGKQMAPFALRVGMCWALVEDLGQWARVSSVELELPHAGYTITLLRHLRERNPKTTFRFIMGSDNLALRHKWYGFDDILADFDPIFVQRAGEDSRDALASQSPVFPDISSTEIRRRLVAGEPVEHLVPKRVLSVLRAEPVDPYPRCG